MAAITTSQVQKAADELASMRRALKGWLKYRLLNDKVLAGAASTRTPLPYAQRVIASSRDLSIEQDLATKLHVLLTEVMPGAQLPTPDLRSNPRAAVELANIALVGAAPTPQAQGGLGGIFGAASSSHPWLWPVLIVGGLLLMVTTAIKTAADLAEEKERLACIQAGACTDFGFFLKAGGIAMLAYVAWNQFGVGDMVKGILRKKGRS